MVKQQKHFSLTSGKKETVLIIFISRSILLEVSANTMVSKRNTETNRSNRREKKWSFFAVYSYLHRKPGRIRWFCPDARPSGLPPNRTHVCDAVQRP